MNIPTITGSTIQPAVQAVEIPSTEPAQGAPMKLFLDRSNLRNVISTFQAAMASNEYSGEVGLTTQTETGAEINLVFVIDPVTPSAI